MKRKQIGFASLFLVIAMSPGMAQIVTLYRVLDMNKAAPLYKLKSQAEEFLGIKARLSGGKAVEVRMYAHDAFTVGGRADFQSLIYGTYSDDGNGTAYGHKYWPVSYGPHKCDLLIIDEIHCQKYGTAPLVLSSGKGTYKSRIAAVKSKVDSGLQSNGILVIIEIEFSGGASEADVVDISLPGVDRIYGIDMLPANVIFPDVCATNPTAKGCALRNAFRNVSDVSNKKPIVIAHRGYHGDRTTPENSLAAVRRAYENGYQYVEMDIRMTRDYVPFLYHDVYMGYSSTFPTLDNEDNSTRTERCTWNEIKAYKYRLRYWNKNTTTVANGGPKSGVYAPKLVYLGQESDQALNSFTELCEYIKDKEIFVFLDIKSSPTERNFEVMKQCMSIAHIQGVLHQLGFKMVRTNQNIPKENRLNMTLSEAIASMGNHHIKFQNVANYHIVDYKPDEAQFIKDWLAPGTVAHRVLGFEFDFQTRPLFGSPALVNNPEFNSKAAWVYTKDLGYRTGIWSATALDPRGRPGHDPTAWSSGKVLGYFGPQSPWGAYEDNRARLEVMSVLAPQYITHDRPDEVARYLTAVNQLNSNSKRQP